MVDWAVRRACTQLQKVPCRKCHAANGYKGLIIDFDIGSWCNGLLRLCFLISN